MSRPTLRPLRRRAFVLAMAALLFGGEARASDSVTAELGAGQSKPTPTIASAPFEYQKIAGRWQATDTLSIAASVRLTHDFAGAPTEGTVLRTASDWVWQGTLGVSHDVSKHVAFGLDLAGSPPARRDIVSPLSYSPSTASGATLDASMRSTGWNAGGAVDLQYDTFDEDAEHAVDLTVDASAGYTHFGSSQVLAAVEEPGGVVPVETLAARCTGQATDACQAYALAATKSTASLEQLRLGATTTFTLWDRTELGVDVAYYVYDRGSPGAAGFFSGFLADRAGRDAGTATWGAGMPVLPTRWSLRPELGQRWDWITVRAYYQLASYAVVPSEVGHTVGGKVTLLLGPWRPYVTGNVREDLAGGSAGASSWTVGAGLQRVL
jgi:hypothetical protein